MNHTYTFQSALFTRPILLFALLLTLVAFTGAAASANAQARRHHHGRLQNDLLAEMQKSVTLAKAQPKAKARRANIARNASRTYEAFTLEVPIDGAADNVRDVIFVEDKRQGKIYEVRGFDFPRPFADLAWKDNDTLVFDQWMQPRYAVHYAIDVMQRKLIAAASFGERAH